MMLNKSQKVKLFFVVSKNYSKSFNTYKRMQSKYLEENKILHFSFLINALMQSSFCVDTFISWTPTKDSKLSLDTLFLAAANLTNTGLYEVFVFLDNSKLSPIYHAYCQDHNIYMEDESDFFNREDPVFEIKFIEIYNSLKGMVETDNDLVYLRSAYEQYERNQL